MSIVLELLKQLDKPIPILRFSNSYEAYYVLLPFIHTKIPDWIFKVGLYLPLVLYLSRNLLNISFDSLMSKPQTAEEENEWNNKYADLLN
jgi:hypothetical protein